MSIHEFKSPRCQAPQDGRDRSWYFQGLSSNNGPKDCSTVKTCRLSRVVMTTAGCSLVALRALQRGKVYSIPTKTSIGQVAAQVHALRRGGKKKDAEREWDPSVDYTPSSVFTRVSTHDMILLFHFPSARYRGLGRRNPAVCSYLRCKLGDFVDQCCTYFIEWTCTQIPT